MHRSKCWTEEEYRERKSQERKRYYGETAYKYKPREWTTQEEIILESFEGTDRELSCILKRSVKAIQHHRAKIRCKGFRNNT